MERKIFILISILFCGIALHSPAKASDTGFVFTYNNQNFEVEQNIIDSWKGQQVITNSKILNPAPDNFKTSLLSYLGQKNTAIHTQVYNYKIKDIYNFIDQLKTKIEVPTIEPELNIENGIVTKFTPPQSGIKVEVYKTAFDTIKSLASGRSNLEITSFKDYPKKQLSETNNLGINELISTGTSNFQGSPSNRRHNIQVGVNKFVGVIVPKGSEFSFNKILGPVEAEQGFLPELVIKKTGTVPEFGGGLCQVSSTAFRSAMEAGLPITQRRNHAYAVQYYAPQGTDATIYPGVIDLKFINDTPGDILIWPYFKDRNTLIFDFYGTKDSRVVTLQKPVQYDKKPDGSLKASWTRIVEKDGQSRTDEFKSTYQPPALFHKTEQFVTATSSVQTLPIN